MFSEIHEVFDNTPTGNKAEKTAREQQVELVSEMSNVDGVEVQDVDIGPVIALEFRALRRKSREGQLNPSLITAFYSDVLGIVRVNLGCHEDLLTRNCSI